MNIITKKKKYKFQVDLVVEELTAVPFVSAVLFCKVHLLEGGRFEEFSSREEVRDHTVTWNARMSFSAKMTAPCTTGVLDPCLCRISVRKETKGGRSYQKLGFATINLAEFAGGGGQCRRYLLEEHDLRHRQDNSMLKVVLSTTLLSGDPCFRAPVPRSAGHAAESTDPPGGGPPMAAVQTALPGTGGLQLKDLTRVRGDCVGGGATSASSSDPCEHGLPPPAGSEDPSEPQGHSRNSSSQSAGYGSLQSQGHSEPSQPTHSRHSSSSESGHLRTASSGSGLSDYNSMERAAAGGGEKRKKDSASGSRFDATRVDAEDVINDLLQHADFDNPDESAETSGLQLYVGRDGSTAFSSGSAGNTASYQAVVISKK
ncbi:protein FAM102A-like [Amphibalanus amphitrite]|uniref:protein FAM102A-like n=1 Tax=Amphibalanus amphitrite TaxID=1232801 RepID=UPI001C90341E|nr:protein FAM102A-like [Amphibalanus amphitrite]